MNGLNITAALLDDREAIITYATADLMTYGRALAAPKAAQAVADLVAAKVKLDDREERLHSDNSFVRVRAAIRAFQEDRTGGAWPNYVNRATVREIAKAAEAPADIVRHILRYPDCSLGLPR